MESLKPNEYQCAVCHGVFERALSDEEALAELQSNFGGFPKDECALVCDDCYNKIMPQLNN